MFYVYVYLDPRKNGDYKYDNHEFDYEPFYVGKGQNNQCLSHLKESELNFSNGNQLKLNKIRKIKKEIGENPIIIKIKENLLENESFDLEMELIKKIGRADLGTGSLVNLTDGGEGHSGYIATEEYRKKQSESHKGIIPSEGHKRKIGLKNKGRIKSEEERKKLSESHKGEKNHMWEKIHSEETKTLISEKRKFWWSISENRNKMKGRIFSEEHRKHLGESRKGKKHSKETKSLISMKLKEWWKNNSEAKEKLSQRMLNGKSI